jgi:hypothetical protein
MSSRAVVGFAGKWRLLESQDNEHVFAISEKSGILGSGIELHHRA